MDPIEIRIEDKTARVAVVGIGYIGEPLALGILEAGYQVIGIDRHATLPRIRDLGGKGLKVYTDFTRVSEVDVVIVCVPTPLGEGQQPDTSFIVDAACSVAERFKSSEGEKLVVLESTSWPGTTRELLLPVFQEAGRSLGEDILLAYCPERVDPGSGKSYEDIPRLVGGLDERSTAVAAAFYRKVVSAVKTVSTPEAAEMAKLLENIFRAVNIALVNEMSLLCRRMDIDIWEVVEAAATKPFGFMSFSPGPGIGGHCIPVDPFFLSWKARNYDFYPEFIELSGKINRNMPYAVAQWVAESLNESGMGTRGARVMVMGVAYKADVGDTRESPALKVIELLADKGAEIHYNDPYVPMIVIGDDVYKSEGVDRGVLGSMDCVAILTAHSDLDPEMFAGLAVPVVDTRNALKKKTCRD